MAKLWTSDELASHIFPIPAYLIEPVLPQGGLAIMHGKPGVGKTLLVVALARAINEGSAFLNKWPARKGPVVVIQADMTGQIQQDRLLRIKNHANLGATYWVAEEDGSIPFLNIQTMSVREPDLVEQIRKVDPLLIVWDTLRKIHHLPENASESAIMVYDAARRIAPTSTHLFIHHNKKESRDPDATNTEDEDFMGNQQWKGAVDATFSLKEIGDTCVPKRMALTFHKARTAADTERRPVALELDMKTVTPVALR